MANKMDTQNDLFDAIYAIATGVVESKNFDITKECKVIEIYTDSKGDRTGIYKVKSQDAVYDAYAKKGENYYNGEMVYVQIPNGDYNAQKFILGRKTSEDTGKDVYNFELPFDNFLGLYSLTEYTPLDGSKGFWANCPQHGIEEQASESDLIWQWINKDESSIFATRLGIEVDLTTLLHGYAPISGHYGFRIIVNGQGKEEIELVKEYFFTDKNMYGNPYAYTASSLQQVLLNIEDFLRIYSIKIYFWQDHDFKDSLGEIIPYGEVNYEKLTNEYRGKIEEIQNDGTLSEEEKLVKFDAALQWYTAETNKASVIKNIIVNGLNVYLGIMTDNRDEQLVLFTYNPITYGADPEHETVRAKERTLRLAWIHQLTKGTQLIDTQEELEANNAKIYWYKYDETWTPDNEEYDESKYPHKFGGLYWRPIDVEGQFVKQVEPDIERSKDRYKAIIHYNGTYVTSNVLIFTNYFDVDASKSDLAKNNQVILRCALLGEDSRLIDDDAIGNFYVYDENNNVLANDDNVSFSKIRYYIEPWVKTTTDVDNTHDGYVRLADYTDKDGNKPEFSIKWQYPENFTMIYSFGELDETIKAESEFYNNCGTTQFELYKKATRWFYIKPNYNVRYANNDIIAEIYIEGYGTCTARKTLQFGRAEAFGAEYVPVITIGTPEGNYYIDTAADFELYCLVYDRKGNLMPEEERAGCKFTWKYIGTDVPSDNRPHENYKNFQGNVIRGRITEPIPFVVEVTVSGAAAYDLTVRRGLMVCNDAEYMQKHDIQCPDRVEFRSDGQQPLWYSAAFDVQYINTETQNTLIYPEWKINTTKVLRLAEKEKDYPVFTLPTGQQLRKDAAKQYALIFSKQYLTDSIANPSTYGQQWTDKLLDSEYFTYIYYEDGEVKVAQAIAFARNLYPSSLVNEWNGQSLSLDEENSSILAKMIAAGTKDAKNRFTGVMMGDWHEKGDESLDIPGLYGFSKGAQSFGFKTDGTGFIGPSGYGRIEFDGTNALISNPTKTCYINLNPRIIGEINNELWDGIGSQGHSQYFIYCELPQGKNIFASENNDDLWWRTNSWATPYLTDLENNDYFIVDPNNGVLTTGGIFARFGQIGINTPWIIHNNGLTQKNFYGTIFLGNAEKNPSKVVNNIVWPQMEDKEKNFFCISAADADNNIQTGVRPDGFFYTRNANIGSWFVDEKEIFVNSTGWVNRDKDKGYLNDDINLSGETSSISFNNGYMIISGKHGWFGSYDYGEKAEDALKPTVEKPVTYDMLLDFKSGTLKFGGKEDGTVYSYIDGKTGRASFSSGNISFDGNTAEIYCGVDLNNGYINQGILNLGGVKIIGTKSLDPDEQKTGLVNYPLQDTTKQEYTISYNKPTSEDTSGDTALSPYQTNVIYISKIVSDTKEIGSINKKLVFEETRNILYISENDGISIFTPGTIKDDIMQKIYLDKIEQISTNYIKVANSAFIEKQLVVSGKIFAQDDDVTLPKTDENGNVVYEEDGKTPQILFDGKTPSLVATRAWVIKYHYDVIKKAIDKVQNNVWWVKSQLEKKIEADNVDVVSGDGPTLVVRQHEHSVNGPSSSFCNRIHGHPVTFTISGGAIKAVADNNVTSAGQNGDSATIFAGKGAFVASSANGVVTISITIAGESATANFNIADLAWYQDQIKAAYDQGESDGWNHGWDTAASKVNLKGDQLTIPVSGGETSATATKTIKVTPKGYEYHTGSSLIINDVPRPKSDTYYISDKSNPPVVVGIVRYTAAPSGYTLPTSYELSLSEN